MIQYKSLWKRTPRKYRLPILWLGLAAVILVLYTFAGSPTLTAEQRFRRAEKAHLVGPAKILGSVQLETDLPSYQNMLIAEDDQGILFFCYDYAADPNHFDQTELIYREKTGDITVLSAPFPNDSREHTTVAALPVFVFDSHPDAVRAELDLKLSVTYQGEAFTKTYQLKAKRTQPGYFQFRLSAIRSQGLGAEGYAIQVLTLLSGYGGRTIPDVTVPAVVRLYDAQDQLICEQQLEITSVVEQAHREH